MNGAKGAYGIKFFGQHLLQKKLLTTENLLKAVGLQEKLNLRFGDYSVKKGYLTQEQVFFVHEEQKRRDRMFGEIAVELGYLSGGQVDEILTLQKNDHRFLGEVLVEHGYLTQEQLDRELQEFEESQREYATDREYFPHDVPFHKYYDVYVDLVVKLMRRVVNTLSKPEAIVRASGRVGNGLLTIGIKFSGGLKGEFLISMSEDKAREIAGATFNQPPGELGLDMLRDAVQEFSNVVCGNVAARMAQLGKEIDIEPPLVVNELKGPGVTAGSGETIWLCPLVTTSGELYAAIVVPSAEGKPASPKPTAKPKPRSAAGPRPTSKAAPAARPKRKPAPKKKKVAPKKSRPKKKPVRRPRKSARAKRPKKVSKRSIRGKR